LLREIGRTRFPNAVSQQKTRLVRTLQNLITVDRFTPARKKLGLDLLARFNANEREAIMAAGGVNSAASRAMTRRAPQTACYP
jgi:hypothetical protein